MAVPPSKPDFSKEDLIGTPVEYAPGAWVCGEKHCPGGTANLKVNNRAFIFKLKLKEKLGGVEKGSDCLFVYGLGKDGVIKGVKDLEKQTGLKAAALLCNGSGHHIQIKKWYDAFPEMVVWVCPTKVPNTLNGKQLRKEYPGRWELADNTTVEHHVYQLLKYFGSGDDMQVDCVLFNQLYGYQDETSRSIGALADSTSKDKYFGQVYFMFSAMPKLMGDLSCPTDDVMFFHKASGLLITGHHFQFVYTPEGYEMPEEMMFEGGFFITKILPKMFFPINKYESNLGESHFVRLRDPKVHVAQWAEVMKWDFHYATGHHDPVHVCGPLENDAVMNGEGGLKGHYKRALDKTGELNGDAVPGSWFPWRYPNKLYTVIQAEDGFVKKFGEPPILPLGGPLYDECGYKKSVEGPE